MRPHFGFLPELHEMIRKLNDNISPQDVAPHGDNLKLVLRSPSDQ